MNIVVLAGGLSPERNVSLSSGVKISGALRGLGHRVALVDMFFGLEDYPGLTPDALYAAQPLQRWERVQREAPDLAAVRASRQWTGKGDFGPGVLELCREADAVFLALHGACGEDGRVQAAFDLLDIPYTGAGSFSTATAMDKDLTKRLVRDVVHTPQWRTVTYTAQDVDALTDQTPVPCVVKPVANGSSIGVSIAHDKPALRGALLEGLRHGGRCVLEQFVRGREFSVGVLEGKALPPIEIIPREGFYDYANKYQPNASLEVCPADIPEELAGRLGRDAVAVFETLGLSVYSRADFIVDEGGTPWFLEINTLPGMTPTSLLPQEAAAVGIDYPHLCETILSASLSARQAGK